MKTQRFTILLAALLLVSAALNIAQWRQVRVAEMQVADLKLAIETTNQVARERSSFITGVLNNAVAAQKETLAAGTMAHEQTLKVTESLTTMTAMNDELYAQNQKLITRNAALEKSINALRLDQRSLHQSK